MCLFITSRWPQAIVTLVRRMKAPTIRIIHAQPTFTKYKLKILFVWPIYTFGRGRKSHISDPKKSPIEYSVILTSVWMKRTLRHPWTTMRLRTCWTDACSGKGLVPLAAQRPFSMGDLADLRLWWEGRARLVAVEAAAGILAGTSVGGGLYTLSPGSHENHRVIDTH